MLALLEGRAEWMQADLAEILAAAPTVEEFVAAIARHNAAARSPYYRERFAGIELSDEGF